MALPRPRFEPKLQVRREHGWPATFRVVMPGGKLPGLGISPSTFVFASPGEIKVDWLLDLTLECCDEQLTIMTNITVCRKNPVMGHVVTAQPFSLSREQSAIWERMVKGSRPKPR